MTDKKLSKNIKHQISLIIHGGNNQISIDSRDVAKEFDRRHDNVMQTIRALIEEGTISPLEIKERDYIKRGKTYCCFQLNEAGFLKVMPFIGGKKSKEGQKRLVDEFLRIRRMLDRQSKEREKLAYQVARLSGKDSRAILTDEIQRFVVYAQSRGSRNADRYFGSITSAVHNGLIILEPKATQVRELLTALQLSKLATIELTAAQVLADGMSAELPYKEIFQSVKSAVNAFADSRDNLLGG
ncbi:MAG: Rha family transcriptional regulator [Methylobacter sp.]|uniref:Rha family transcriptional regulator n=1 Tax=Candidatus Methylobacter titanis TaxID=3053457 RepID=A0AA43TJ32_9GAMM|nr:Rha family transcriptional regulator [Candidatus Methylobacter titanis]